MQRTPQPQTDLDWDDVRLFLALCRTKTAGEAARALKVDGSTVSRRLTALEEVLGATLFERGRDGTAQTKAAEDLLAVAEEIEAVMMRFSTAAEGLEREVAGMIRITCPPDLADAILAKVVGELLRRHPKLRVELEPGEALLDLTRREADIALRTVRPTRGDLLVRKLTTARWVAATTPALAKKLKTLHAWSDCPWVGWGERFAGIGPQRWISKHVVGAEPIARSDSLLVQLSLVKAGVGVALVPEPSLQHYGLVQPKVSAALRASTLEWPVNDLFLVTHRALRQVPRVRAVWEGIVATMGDRHRVKKESSDDRGLDD